MASKRDRQRKLERARAERRIARQAERARRKRQIQAGVGASLALILIVLGVTWLLGGFDPKPRPTVASGTCTWQLLDTAEDADLTDIGHPPTTGEARTGTAKLAMKTNLGDIEAEIDLTKAPCTAASFKFLGEQKYYEGSRCHRLSTESKLIQCGDGNGNGSGNPAYTFADEDIPQTPLNPPSATPTPSASPGASASPSASAKPTYYAKGTIVMANTGANTNSGQFYIIYGDNSDLGPAYSIVGRVTKGLELVEEIAKGGAKNPQGDTVPDGRPVKDLIIQSLSVGTPAAPTPSASASASPSASPTPSAGAPAGILPSPLPSTQS